MAVPYVLARRRVQQHRDQRRLQRGRGQLRRRRRQLLGPGARRRHADGAHPRPAGHHRRDHVHLAHRRAGNPGQRGHRRPDRRAVRVRGPTSASSAPARTAPRAEPVTVHYTDGSSQSYNLNMADWYSNSPAVGNQILTTTSSWNCRAIPSPAPGERLLRLGAAAAGQAGGLGHAAHPQQCGRHHRHAHLRHGHGNRNPDERRAVLLTRCGLQQRRDQRQLQPRRGRLRRHRRQLLGAGAGRGHAHPAHRLAARPPSAGPPSPGPAPSARPTT